MRAIVALLYLVALTLTGCASYTQKSRPLVAAFESNQYEVAANSLIPLIAKKDQDLPLHLLQLGTVFHAAGRYQDAVETFREAERIVEQTDYTSISQEAGSVLVNESVKTHRLDDYEKVLISMYLAIDYTLLGQWESALVECRRVNHQLDMMISSGHPNYSRNSFAKYLAGALFEATGEWNDAWVDYRQVEKWNPDFPLNPVGLLRMSSKLRAEQEFLAYKKAYPATKEFALSKNQGELVVLVETGRAPEKVPDPEFAIIPKFVSRGSLTKTIQIREPIGNFIAKSHVLFDIEAAAINELQDKRAGAVAKRLASVAVKKAAAVAAGNATKNKNVEVFGDLLIHLTERPDLRSWLLLPGNLQIARLTLPAGKHDLIVEELNSDGVVIQSSELKQIEVQPLKLSFIHVRAKI